MNKKIFKTRLINILVIFVSIVLIAVPVYGQENLETVYSNFKTAAKAPCGQRDEAIRLGKLIIERFGNDELNKEVIDFVKKKVAEFEKDDKVCKRGPSGDGVHKNWKEFFASAKDIIAAEGDSPIALDVMLDLVSAGFDRVIVDKDNTFISDTFFYAKLAAQKIEAGQKSKKWGAFFPFDTKENALGWLNYIVGWLSYYKLNQKQEALPFFYKATQNKNNNQKIVTAYRIIAEYYMENSKTLEVKFEQDSKNIRNDDSKASLELIKGYKDRAIDAYSRAYKLLVENKEKKALIDNYYRILTTLYRSRFNLDPKDKVESLDEYIEKLVNRPMPDLTAPIKPILEDPIGARIKRNKLQ